jgi:hypothetical protein
MFHKKAHEADVSIYQTSYGFWKLQAKDAAAVQYLSDNGFMPVDYSPNTPYEIEEPVARFIARSYLEPHATLKLYAPQLAPRSFYA